MDPIQQSTEVSFRSHVRQWLIAHLPEGWDPTSTRTAPMEERLRHFGRGWERRLLNAGLNGLSWPVEFGGQGATIAEEMVLLEESARLNIPESINNVAKTMLGPTLMAHGTIEQQQRYLGRILSGEHIWCQVFSEPDAGSDLANIRTTAERVMGGWSVHGQKLWTSRAQYSDRCFAIVRTDAESQRRAGLSVLLVALDQPGVAVRPLRQANGDDEFNEVWFDGALVADADVLGGVGDGWRVARTILSYERGTAHFGRHVRFRRQLEQLIKLATGLEISGVPATTHAHYRDQFMEALAESEIYRLLTRRELGRLQSEEVGMQGSFLKLFWTEMYQRQERLALELLGPHADLLDGPGALDEDRHGLRYLSALSRSIAGGTSEIQRNIVAETTLGLPRGAR